MPISRRHLVAGLAGLAAARPASAQEDGPSLGAVAGEVGVVFGTAFDREILQDEPYRRLVAQQSRILATENALKFDWLKPRGPTADFAVADELVAFAERNGIPLRGTALIWNDWPPPWLRRLSPREIAATLDRHIDEVVGRYRGRVAQWDVVNEPFYPPHRRDGGYRMGPWLDALGPDYIHRAFRRAHAADPAAKLVLNEAFCEQDDALGRSIRPLLLREVDRMRDSGVPLHGVGLEAHLKPQLPFDDAATAAFAAEIARRDVDVLLTELDVDDTGMPDDPAERDRRVARRHGDFLAAMLPVPRLTTVVTWQLSDRYSWYRNNDWYGRGVAGFGGTASRLARTHLYDDALRPKPARAAVERALIGRAVR